MVTAVYYKIGKTWFLDLPEYLENGGNVDDLERIGGFHELLEMAADGSNSVVLYYDLNDFDGADMAELKGLSGEKTGGYYNLKHFEGREVDLEIWVNKLAYEKVSELPQHFYLKKQP